MLVTIIENSVQDAFRPVHDLIKCLLSTRAPQFVILCKSVFYFEEGEGLIDVGATSAFVTSMHSIFFTAKLYHVLNDNEASNFGVGGSYLDDDSFSGGHMILIRDLVGSHCTRERTAIHLVRERGIKSKLLLPGALSINGLIDAERCQLSIRYDRGTCVLECMDKAYCMTYVPIGSRRLCLTLTNTCHNMIMSSFFNWRGSFPSYVLVPCLGSVFLLSEIVWLESGLGQP